MTDLMVPSKRPRAPSLADKLSEYSESHASAAVSDWLPKKETDQVQVKSFLELCRFCKKNLRHDEDVFMYGYFGAFCSRVCRAKQMACDILTERRSSSSSSSSREKAKAKKGRICGTKPKESEEEALDKTATSRFYI